MTSDSSSKPPNSVNSVDEYLNLTGQNTQTESGNGYESNLLNKNNSQMIYTHPNAHTVQSPTLIHPQHQHHHQHNHHNHQHHHHHHVEDMKPELSQPSSASLTNKSSHESQNHSNNNSNIIKNEISDTKNIDDLARQFKESTHKYVQQNSVTNGCENPNIVNRNQFEASLSSNNNNNSSIDLSSQKSSSFNNLKSTSITNNTSTGTTAASPSTSSSSSNHNYIQYLNDPKHLINSQFNSSSSSNLVHSSSNNEMIMIHPMSLEKSNETKNIPILINSIDNFNEKNEKIENQFITE